ncbi:hypothetical protein ASD23_00765 [Agromyces sp. Root1464]|nr:hypothetical protein ASD23_00765 [Agromyces sp. Root1464]
MISSAADIGDEGADERRPHHLRLYYAIRRCRACSTDERPALIERAVVFGCRGSSGATLMRNRAGRCMLDE